MSDFRAKNFWERIHRKNVIFASFWGDPAGYRRYKMYIRRAHRHGKFSGKFYTPFEIDK